MESSAFEGLRLLRNKGYFVFLQHKASRFVVARADIIADKVDADLEDSSKYVLLEEEDTEDILDKIKAWWMKNNKLLSVVDEDILNWLLNPNSKPGKMKILLKTHKPDLPVREVFSVCSQPVEHLSAFLQHSYLGPIVSSGVLKWRLRDTKELLQFIHSVNDQIKK